MFIKKPSQHFIGYFHTPLQNPLGPAPVAIMLQQAVLAMTSFVKVELDTVFPYGLLSCTLCDVACVAYSGTIL
jgi:hypothetical protein